MNYDEAATCSKCGYSDVSTDYVNPGRAHNLSRARQAGKMERQCARCHFVWYETAKDEMDEKPLGDCEQALRDAGVRER